MQITINIDENEVMATAKKAAEDAVSFRGSDSYSTRGPFYNKVKEAVAEQLAKKDFSAEIARIASQKIDGLIAEAVISELKRNIVTKAREMRESGKLATLVEAYFVAPTKEPVAVPDLD